jgi:phosphatidate cytidylyltransferase
VFWQRLLSALIGIPLLIAAVWYGGVPLIAVTAALMLLGIREINRIFSQIQLQVPIALALAGCLILLVAAYQYKQGYPGAGVVAILVLNLLTMVLFYPRFSPQDIAVTFLSTLYVGLISYLFLLSTLDNGRVWLILLLVCTWANDTVAYLVGCKWGRHRMAPTLSPGKTVEGAVCGVLGSILAALLVIFFSSHLPLLPVLLLGALVGIAGQVGDLVESALKRQAGIKDAGRLIPGHGGILDRFDSMLFTAPLVYHFVGLIIIS